MTLERGGRWWPGREMAMARKEAEAERWQRMTYEAKVAEQAAAARASRAKSISRNVEHFMREEAEARRRILGLIKFRVGAAEEISAWQLTREQFEARREARARLRHHLARWPKGRDG